MENFTLKELKQCVEYCGGDKKKVKEWIKNCNPLPTTLKELLSYNKLKTVDYGDFPNDIQEDVTHCIYTFEKGYTTSLNRVFERFCDYFLDDEDENVWDDEKKEYNYDALEKAFNKYIPGFAKFLIDNQVGAIRNYW